MGYQINETIQLRREKYRVKGQFGKQPHLEPKTQTLQSLTQPGHTSHSFTGDICDHISQLDNTQPDHVTQLLTFANHHYEDPEQAHDILTELGTQHKDHPHIVNAVATNPQTPPSILEMLTLHARYTNNLTLAQLIAEHRNVNSRTLWELSSHPDHQIQDSLTKRAKNM